MGLYLDGQAGLKLLTSGDPPTSASQSARMTGVSHRARPVFFFSWSFTLFTQAGVKWCKLGSLLRLPPGFKRFLLPCLSSTWDCRDVPPCPANIVFLVEMGLLHVGQAGLELLTSGDPPTFASQIAGITGVSHRARPVSLFLLSRQGLTLWPRLVWSQLTATSASWAHLLHS